MAAIVACQRSRRFALLGFGAGGIVAPLRALGFSQEIRAVELDPRREKIFRSTARYPVGKISVSHSDAVVWLRRERRRYDVILDDLSIPSGRDVEKPAVSLTESPSAHLE